ncbi:hypothetical protein O6H91_03G067600 [Diphasiastrum complanatum]|uniref:Uncharacterized protein n=1 Tax=Diphasiastrum complanatum TaxID=34168 RepID=A0ACC2E7G5_DIPCM|nr:hypothetical protein O6H91_03G067600 [Diphasiastrum complanatum]
MWGQNFLGFVALSLLLLPAIGSEGHGSCPFSSDHSHADSSGPDHSLDHDHHQHSHHHPHEHLADHDSHQHSHISHDHLQNHVSYGVSDANEHNHGAGCSHDHGHDDHHGYGLEESHHFKLPEELAEEEELTLYGFGSHQHEEQHGQSHQPLSITGLWLRAMGSSLLVSMASLVCLMLLPFILSHGKPSQDIVNALAAFGAGAMLGDAFLHQLPHAFGSSGNHALHHHEHNHDHSHVHTHEPAHVGAHGHAHSIEDLSVGLSVLFGIFAFFTVEKIVRKVEELSTSRGGHSFGHKHHHHYQKNVCDSKEDAADEKERKEDSLQNGDDSTPVDDSDKTSSTASDKSVDADVGLRRKKGSKKKDKSSPEKNLSTSKDAKPVETSSQDGPSNLVLGYLNLFSDGVHNFTDGMALGTAFLHHGTIGGWSRTLFLLAHELPQEVGDFGILVRSGFGVFKALAFNFLSALVALAGTALALLLGGNPGHSSLIEGFTAGGFIYIAVAGVLPEMHQQANSLKQSLSQLTSLSLGVGVAILISLAE